jgi:mannose-6-phosphate isomerase-like protein (cupin superfamily)
MAMYQPFPMLAGRGAQAWRHQPAFRRPRHFHDEPELNVVLSGWCTVGIGERTVTLQAGDVVFFQPGQDHALLEESAHLDLFVMALTPELADRVGVTSAKRTGVQRLDEVARMAIAEFLVESNSLSDASEASAALAGHFHRELKVFDAITSFHNHYITTVELLV